MIKEIAWNTFKNTGNIDTFMELRQLENYEKTNLKINKNEKIKFYDGELTKQSSLSK